jgi:Cytochrome c554 and c-prime
VYSLPVFFLLLLGPSTSGVDLKPMSSAEFCGRCHRAIVDSWKSSAHARAMESPLFQDVLEMAENETGSGVRKVCLGCHSPVSIHSGDVAMRQKVSWEGVTCDYCHSIREVTEEGLNPKVLVEYTLVKSGPLKDASSMAHGTVFSPVHQSSRVCAPCHDYRNALGFPVLTTYTEWKASRYAKEGKNCQSCHMYSVAGDVVDPRIQRSSLSKINLHQMPGSHSLEQLTRTIKSRLTTAREGDKLQVSVEVTNQAAGHYVPTGSPLRQLRLVVQADSYDGKHLSEQRVYQRVIADQSGKPIQRESVAFVQGAKVVLDTRLAPSESRKEVFSFAIPRGVKTVVKATLKYFYSPMARSESQKEVTFLTMSQLVP